MKHYKDTQNNVFGFDSFAVIPEDLVEITLEEAKNIGLKKETESFKLLSYSEKRVLEYPDFKEYLDGIVKGDKEQVQAYIDACNAVKAKYPKG
jgi:hypothetical protein